MTKPIHAIYENGVFRPVEPVDLPESTVVQVQTPAEVLNVRALVPPGTDQGLIRVYECLAQSYETGDPDAALF